MNIAVWVRSFAAAADGAPDPGTQSLLHLRDFLSREWRPIAMMTVLSLAIGAAYVATAPRKYTAKADLIIDTEKITWTHGEMSSETRTVDDARVETALETTRSDRVAKIVVRQLGLIQDPEFVGPDHGIKARILALFKRGPQPEPSSDELMQRALSTIDENLRVTRMGRSYVEQIAYTSSDPEKAAKIANTFAEAYVEDQLQAKYEQTRRASEWLEKRIGELRQQASDAYKAVQDFKSNNSIIVGVDGKLVSDVELDQLGIALAKARADTSQARAKLERIQTVLKQRSNNNDNFSIPDPVITDALISPIITKLRQQFLDDQNQEVEWRAKYGANHNSVKNLRAKMTTLQSSIWDEISRIAESYKSELQIAKSQEEAIDKRMTEVFRKSGSTRQAQVRLRELETGANTYREIYETFLSRFTQSVQQQSFPSTKARVVTDAPVPRAPSSPQVAIILAFAALCGLGFGVMSAIAREQLMNRQIYTCNQLEKLLGTTCLAVLPVQRVVEKVHALTDRSGTWQETTMLVSKVNRTLRGWANYFAVGAVSKAYREISKQMGKLRGGEPSAFYRINEVSPFSAIAEAFRYIKLAIDLHPTGAKVIGVTSALPGEGKTTVAAAFAAFVAKNGARTLLIDADLRTPSLSRILGYDKEFGLINMVEDGIDFDELVITDPKFNFDFLPSPIALRPSNSADALKAPAIRNLLKKASNEYDYILCDLPPVLPIVDVKATAHLFDAFILVVEWGSTSTNEILNAIRSSPLVSERLLGAVLNKADETVMRRFEGYSDRRYSYYRNAGE